MKLSYVIKFLSSLSFSFSLRCYQPAKINDRVNHRKMGCGCGISRNIIQTGFQPLKFGVGSCSGFRRYFLGCGR